MAIKIGGLYQTFAKQGGQICAYPKTDGFFQMLDKHIPLIVIDKCYSSDPEHPMFLCLVNDKLYAIAQECISELNV
jgi:hypothetical protein